MNSFADRYSHKPWANLLPDSSLKVCKPNLELFFETMFERQEVWYKRHVLQLPAPWTEDPYFANFKFTNVYRELDRSSLYTINNIISKLPDDPYEQLWQIMLYRLFNRPETFQTVKLPSYHTYDKDAFASDMKAFWLTGENPFTIAYLINGMGCQDYLPKFRCYTERAVPIMHGLIPKIWQDLQLAEERQDVRILMSSLMRIPNVAGFVSHEFYQDLCYIPTYTKSGKSLMSFDQDSFTNVGPGAATGIRMIFPNCKNTESQKSKIYLLRDMSEDRLRRLGRFKYAHWSKSKQKHIYKPIHNITLHQIEMWLCEYQKYQKMIWQTGKQRSSFTPHEQRAPTLLKRRLITP